MLSVSNAPHFAAPAAPQLPLPERRRAIPRPPPAHGFTVGQVRSALCQLLASPEFCKATRMCRLIRFLVEKELDSAAGAPGEYTIGIEVFDRDARSYATCEDPIVRVQVGRLRERLKLYYAATGAAADLRFSIPIGSYMPTISRHSDSDGHFPDGHLLAILPLLNFTQDLSGLVFTRGLSEELSCQLFKVFGHKIVSHTFAAPDPAASARPPGVSHVLEGSVRVDDDRIRVSLRLVDAGGGCIAWSEQFDRRCPFAIALQEELALAICDALQGYFAHG